MRTSKTVNRWVFGAGTVAALGFGGAQALASPAPAARAAAVCDAAVCNRICQAIPGSIGGFCTSGGSCVCYIGE
jgi:hypothetical protein